jgi:hypothetical protein
VNHDELRAIVDRLRRHGIIETGELYRELGGDDASIEDHDEAQAMLAAAGWQYDIWLDRYVKGRA